MSNREKFEAAAVRYDSHLDFTLADMHSTNFYRALVTNDLFELWQTARYHATQTPEPELTQKQIVLAQMVVELLPVYSTTDNVGTPYTVKGIYESDELSALKLAKRILEACKDE